MPTSDDNLVLEHLRHIRGRVDDTAEDMREVKLRLGNLEAQIAGLTNGYASLSSRLDRLDARVERIERRLDLEGAPAR